jgi:hypothetical protein
MDENDVKRLTFIVCIVLWIIAIVIVCRAHPLVHAAPAPLVVDALSVPDGVLVSWSSPQPRALVFRRRQGSADLFLGQYSGLALTDCGGRSGDVYRVEAWDADGSSLLARGESGEARWRMWLVEVGR